MLGQLLQLCKISFDEKIKKSSLFEHENNNISRMISVTTYKQ
jgi:hypothetical protein